MQQEHQSPSSGAYRNGESAALPGEDEGRTDGSAPEALPPPDDSNPEQPAEAEPIQPQLPVAPLPPPVAGDGAPIQALDNQIAQPGNFVPNDAIDEGVMLLSKLHHGDNRDGVNLAGPGTRSRRERVQVICVARCPHGGHFATGSSDGVCRVWSDEDDPAVKFVDDTFSIPGRSIRSAQAEPRQPSTPASAQQTPTKGQSESKTKGMLPR